MVSGEIPDHLKVSDPNSVFDSAEWMNRPLPEYESEPDDDETEEPHTT